MVYIPAQRINRYIVGCKLTYNGSLFIDKKELIDTQWDVNNHKGDVDIKTANELIDTQWDVNLYKNNETERVRLSN